MRVTNFGCCPQLTDEFVRFGYRVHADLSWWIPPFESEIRYELSPDFEFFDVEGNRIRHFIVRADGEVVGRITTMINALLRDPDGRRVGCVGFFECVPDYRVAERLLDAALEWLKGEGQVQRVWGPMNFDIWHGYRFMTRGFDQEPFVGEPRNPAYYPRFFERYGFKRRAEWDSVEIRGRDRLEGLIERGRERHRLLTERGYRFEAFNHHNWVSEILKLHHVVSRSFGGFLGFTPVSSTEFARLCEAARHAILPHMSYFVYDEAGRIAGFTAAFLELGDAVRSMEGRDDWRARLRFLARRRQASKVNFYIGGITPEEARRGTGLGRAGVYRTVRQALESGYDDVLFTLRLKGGPSRAYTARFGPESEREYALYEMEI